MSEFLETRKENGVLTVKLKEKIDGNTSDSIQEEVIEMITADNDLLEVIFDVNDVSYVSSAGLRMFSSVSNVCRTKMVDYRIVGLREDIMRMFQLTGYANIFKIEVKPEVV